MSINLNERTDIMEQIALEFEAFTDDILSALSCNDFIIQYSVDEEMGNYLFVTWDWKKLNKHLERVFITDASDTEEAFLNSIKAYLFDLAVMLINL